MHWHRAIHECAEQNQPYVIVSVLATSGSAPRDAGTKMVVTPEATHDTIGGGGFEQLAVERARTLLAAMHTTQTIEHFPLAAGAQQCCGGSVTLLFECFAEPPLEVVVFGAGHVGARVAGLLSELNTQLRWIDNRASLPEYSPLATDATLEHHAQPADLVAEIPAAACVVIVTHDHQLDYQLVSALLARRQASAQSQPAGLIGLIGSTTKWQRFSQRLARDGFSQTQIEQIHCPIGDPGITSKEPMAVAIAIVAQLLQSAAAKADSCVAIRRDGEPSTAQGIESLSWRQIKTALVRDPT